MIKPHPRHGKYFIGAFLALFFLAGKPPEFGEENQFFQGFLIKNPVIKIGLGVNLETLTIRASSGMKVYEVGADYRLLARDMDEINVKGHKEKLTEKFVLQVAQTAKRVEAERLAARLRPDVSRMVSVVSEHEAGADTLYQVRVGDFLTRSEALGFIKELNRLGIKEAWILREEVTEEESHPVWVLVGDELKTLNKETVIYFIPSDQQSYLFYNGIQYRGIFVLRASPKGLVLVNILNLENYLRGVVPEEMSPDQFNSFEALKAQAVAARTYAIKNMGQNRTLGFDLCDTPKCQVYGGLSAEHAESSRAVEETRGEVAVYKGKLINALYTSTCGGMTEDVENVFEGRPQPYLKSTECTYEKQKEWTLETRPLVSLWMNGRAIEREAAMLIGAGVIPRETNPSYFLEPARSEEASRWIERALALVGRSREVSLPEETILNFSNLARLIVTSFQWEDRVNNLMLPSEVEFVLRDFPPVSAKTRGSLAYLIHSGIFPSLPEMVDETRTATRGEMVYILSKAIRNYFDPREKGRFRSLNKKREMDVEVDGESRIIPLSPDVFLFRTQAGETSPAARLYLLGGEDVRWIEKGGEIRFLEVSYPAVSATLDRGSPYHRWQVRQTRLELEKRINEYYPIGELQDIVVQARGKSRRVTELQIIGTESQVIVKGLKIRWVLGLRDILFTLDREFDEGGRVTHYLFSGRGWGHGVGLCQVGAFRMAQSGASYKEILKKYYRDVKITRQY
ncbi:MAG TPA: SpoIID/LytB domain-containing protein [Candidatus Desulfaltia sp.]|nr:SpoIID/LytB domain-containing protein [Candidatus Desulfaltia sp.]